MVFEVDLSQLVASFLRLWQLDFSDSVRVCIILCPRAIVHWELCHESLGKLLLHASLIFLLLILVI
jgi:hypothetical protein